jgi:hypothetical protein
MLTTLTIMPRPRKNPKLRMGTDLRIPVTKEQKKLIVEATSDEPGGMAAWARAVLLNAAGKKKESKMLDGFDKTFLAVTYNEIDQSSVSRVSGSRVFDRIRAIFPEIAPVVSPGRLGRLVSQGLLAKDKANSSSRTKVYAPTDPGRKMWEELKTEMILGER